MAENGLGEEQNVARVAANEPEALPPGSENTGDERRAGEPGAEKALVEALRGFVRREAGKPEPSPPEKIGKRQAIVLLIFSIDIALVYSQFNHWLQGIRDVFYQELLKVVPWMLGATAVSYADRMRQFLLKQARHWKWAMVAVALPVPLLIIHLPIFSFQVHLPSAAFKVNAEDRRVEPTDEGSGLYRLVFPSLGVYHLTAMGPEEKKDYWVAYPVTLGRMRILRATIAASLSHIPLVRRAFRQEVLPMGPLYNVPTESDKDADVHVEGQQFPEGFFEDASLKAAGCLRAEPIIKGRQAARCPVVAGGGGFSLPPGWYDFTLARAADNCSYHWPNDYEVKALALLDVVNPKNELVDFDKRCSK
jgi:hypothetical protein